MYIDYKIEHWERVYIRDDCNMTQEEILELVKTSCGNSFLWDCITPEPTLEPLDETDDYMSPEDNGGSPTIEFYDSNDKLIWDNGRKEEE